MEYVSFINLDRIYESTKSTGRIVIKARMKIPRHDKTLVSDIRNKGNIELDADFTFKIIGRC